MFPSWLIWKLDEISRFSYVPTAVKSRLNLFHSFEWPLAAQACADEVDDETDDDEDGSVAYLSQKVLA